MQPQELIDLVDKIQHYKCEFQTIEVKAAKDGCPKRLYDSLSAFSNQDEGGVIIFGLDERLSFEAVGVYDIQDLQHNVAEQCKQMEPEVRPLFTTAEINGKFIVSAEIPTVEADQRPVYYKGAGRQRGSFVRVGESDEQMNDYEIYDYDAFRRRIRDDIRIVDGADIGCLREDAIQSYLKTIRENSKNLSNITNDKELMELTGITKNGFPTLAAVFVFGKYPQAFFPMLGITAVVVPGNEIGDTGSDEERFIANKRINGTISEMLDEAVEFVRRNSRIKTIIDENGKRKDKPEFPIKAVRESVLNALLHRDYSLHSEGTPITICMFSDRMEITNKGGLYGKTSLKQLGKVRAEIRNTTLATLLENLSVSENRYSGIPTIINEMELAGLPEPKFISKNGEFKVILRNNMERNGSINNADITIKKKSESRANDLLVFCKTPRSRDEIASHLGLSRYYTMKEIVNPLIEKGSLTMTIPEKPKSKKQKYVTRN